jgi:hypothetical protein
VQRTIPNFVFHSSSFHSSFNKQSGHILIVCTRVLAANKNAIQTN